MADSDDDILEEADEDFGQAIDAENDNRIEALADLKFARLEEQWPDALKKDRETDGRPCLTLNHLPAFIRQVVNDCRQNKPAIKVSPIDSGADIRTAQTLDGIIRNIEQESSADIAYDTGVEFAASMGWGYFCIDIDYAHDDTFDLDLRIKRVANPFSVYGDPYSTSATSEDWNRAFVIETMSIDEFKAQWPNAELVDWTSGNYADLRGQQLERWRDDDDVIVARYWRRKEVPGKLYMLSNGAIVRDEIYEKNRAEAFDPLGITITNERATRSYKVCQYVLTGAEVLETNEWASKYIPIIPVYGEELNIEGKRYFRSLIRSAKDAQKQHNYWESTATELAALQPRVPYIGEEGAFDVDPRWASSNKRSHPYLEHKKGTMVPQRQPLDSGPALSAISQSQRSIDSMKSIMGLYNASLGERSNETSGVAINSRKVEGEVSTFHFPDNLARAIGHGGRILLDLIPQVYTPGRIMRALGEDGTAKQIVVGDPKQPQSPMPTPETMGPGAEQSQETPEIYNIGMGKYDVAVKAGPSYTTRRQETAAEMMDLIKAYPPVAPIIGDLLVKNLDWRGADEMAKRLKAMLPPTASGGPPPELQQMIEEGKKLIGQLQQENQTLEQQNAVAEAQKKIADAQHQLELQEKDLKIQELEAEKKLSDMISSHEDNTRAKQPANGSQAGVALNMPETMAAPIAEAVSQAIVQALSQLPPLQVNMPPAQRMRRTPVRDPKTNLILHTIDEPMNGPEGMH